MGLYWDFTRIVQKYTFNTCEKYEITTLTVKCDSNLTIFRENKGFRYETVDLTGVESLPK